MFCFVSLIQFRIFLLFSDFCRLLLLSSAVLLCLSDLRFACPLLLSVPHVVALAAVQARVGVVLGARV